MKNTERAYIGIELGTHTWNVDLEQNGEEDILDEGIDCYPEDVYAIIYNKVHSPTEINLNLKLLYNGLYF